MKNYKKIFMKDLKIIFFSLFSLAIVSNIDAQYKIELEIPSFPNDTLLFGHYFSESLMLQDTFYTDATGKATIKGEKDLPEGMYTIFFPNRNRFDLLIDEDQTFSVKTETNNILKNTVIMGSRDNELFYDYLSYLDQKRKESEKVQMRIKTPLSENDSIAAREELKKINQDVKKYVEEIINKNPDLFISKFLISMKEVKVPEPPRDENGVLIDSSFSVKYYKKHYFDHFDLSDVRMLRTPLYEQKLKTYLNKWVYPLPDSIYREVDWLIEKSRTDTLLFKYMLTTLFNHYASSKYAGMDAVYAYIAKNYYIPEASWSSPEFISDLKERVEKINPLLIGKTAPDVELISVSDEHFMAAKNDTALKRNPYVGRKFNLHQVEGDYIILYFWEADCGHCKKTIPQLYELWEKMNNNNIRLRVIAISMLGGIEGKVKWTNFVNEHNTFGWINAWNPYDFSYKDVYDVASSNILYLLDGNMEIVAKKISPDQVEQLIEKRN